MKTSLKIIVISFLLISIQKLNAQDNETSNSFTIGQKLIGGSANFGTSNSEIDALDSLTYQDADDRLSISFNPYIGKFIADDLLVGFSITYSYQETKFLDYQSPANTSTSEYYFHTIGAQTFMKKYYTIHGKFGTFIKPYIYYSRSFGNTNRISKSNSLINSQKTEEVDNSIGLGLDAGLFLRVGSRFILETNLAGLSARYTKGTVESENDSRSSERSNKGIGLNFANTMSFDQIIRINYIF